MVTERPPRVGRPQERGASRPPRAHGYYPGVEMDPFLDPRPQVRSEAATEAAARAREAALVLGFDVVDAHLREARQFGDDAVGEATWRLAAQAAALRGVQAGMGAWYAAPRGEAPYATRPATRLLLLG